MTYELGSIIAGVGAVLTTIVTAIISINNNRIAKDNLNLSKNNIDFITKTKFNRDTFLNIAHNISCFLTNASSTKMMIIYKRAMIADSSEKSYEYNREMYSVIGEIENSINNIVIYGRDYDNDMVTHMNELSSHARRIVHLCMDLKVMSEYIDKNYEESVRNVQFDSSGGNLLKNSIEELLPEYANNYNAIKEKLLVYIDAIK